MVIILSARKCCEDQVSGNSKSDHAASQTAKNSTLRGGRFASLRKCGTSRACGADSYIVRLFKSNELRQSHGESERFSDPHNVLFRARRSPQRVLQPGNLYGFPTAPRGSFQGCCVNQPKRFLLARSRIPRALPLAPVKRFRRSEFLFEVSTSVWPGCDLQHFVVNHVRRESMVQ